MTVNIDPSYFGLLATIESSNQPYVKAPTSSGSGLYQFLKATWTKLGGSWGSDSSKAFGGLTPTPEEQTQRAQALTQQNAQVLNNGGVPINNATLYAAHFLGPEQATQVLAADPNSSMVDLVGDSVIAANPFMGNMTVNGFKSWLAKKTGANVDASTTPDLSFSSAILNGTQIDPSSFVGQALVILDSNVVSPATGAVKATAGAAGDLASTVTKAVQDGLNSSASTLTGKLAAFWDSLVKSVSEWPGKLAGWFTDHAFAGVIILAGLSIIVFSLASGLSGSETMKTLAKGAAVAAMV